MTTRESARSQSSRPLASMHPGSTEELRHELVRAGVERMLAQALEVEAELHISRHRDLRDESGKRLVVRNGYLPTREIDCGAGPIQVHQPRVNDGRLDSHGRRTRYSSNVLPAYSRSATGIERPSESALYFGLATGDLRLAFEGTFGAILDELPRSFVPRLGELWESDRERLTRRSLQGRDYAEIWADAVPVPRGQGEFGEHTLLFAATLPDGVEVLDARVGHPDSSSAWETLLDGLVRRGFVARLDRLRSEVPQVVRNAFAQAADRSSR